MFIFRIKLKTSLIIDNIGVKRTQSNKPYKDNEDETYMFHCLFCSVGSKMI